MITAPNNIFHNYIYEDGYEVDEIYHQRDYFKLKFEDGSNGIGLEKFLILKNTNKQILVQNEVIDGPSFVPIKTRKKEKPMPLEKTTYGILPKNLDTEASLKKINLEHMYTELIRVFDIINLKPKLTNYYIQILVNKYGMLLGNTEENKLRAEKSLLKEAGLFDGPNPAATELKPIAFNIYSRKTDYFILEYIAWKWLLNNYIPSKLEYVSDKKYFVSDSDLNRYCSDIRLNFNSKSFNDFNLKAENLISQFIYYTNHKKTAKQSVVVCQECNIEVEQSSTKGRLKRFCSSACKQSAYRKRNKK